MPQPRFMSIGLLVRHVATSMILVTAAGCGDAGIHHVTGVVRYADGSPVPEGRVFVDYGPGIPFGAAGMIHPDGSFTIGRFAEGDGMKAGKVRVAVIAFKDRGSKLPALPIVHERFGDPSRSNLVFDVPAQVRWEIVVERPPTE